MIQEPVQPTSNPTPSSTGKRRNDGLLFAVVVAVGLALAVVVIVMTQRPTPADTPLALVAGASPSADPDAKPQGNGQGQKPDKANKLGKGNSAPGRGQITIQSIAGSALSLGTEDGWTRTITVTSSTVITKGGQPVAVDALKVGDEIRFSQTRNPDGTYAVTAIVVQTPVAGGEVTAVDSTTITVKGKGGSHASHHREQRDRLQARFRGWVEGRRRGRRPCGRRRDGQRGYLHGDHRQDPAGHDRRDRHGEDRQFDHGQAR